MNGWLRATALAAVFWLVAAGPVFAQDAGAAAAHSIKAAYLFKLPAYVDWPAQRFESARSPLVIGVLGSDAVADALATITAGRSVNGRPVVARRLGPDDGLAGVHVLFYSDAARGRAAGIATAAAAQNILTVTDSPGESQDSVIDFINMSGRVRFEVRLNAAERNGLKLNASLLAVAARVYGARR